MIQAFWFDYVVIDDPNLEAALRGRRKVFDEFLKLWAPYTVRTVYRDRSIELLCSHGSFERRGQFLIISFLGWFAILIRCAFCIHTARNVMELWRSK